MEYIVMIGVDSSGNQVAIQVDSSGKLVFA